MAVGLRQHQRRAAGDGRQSHRPRDVPAAAQHGVGADAPEQAARRADGRAGRAIAPIARSGLRRSMPRTAR